MLGSPDGRGDMAARSPAARRIRDAAKHDGTHIVIRSIRLLGAALGVLVGLTLASIEGGLFTGMQYSGAVLAAWTIAWLVAGFGGAART